MGKIKRRIRQWLARLDLSSSRPVTENAVPPTSDPASLSYQNTGQSLRPVPFRGHARETLAQLPLTSSNLSHPQIPNPTVSAIENTSGSITPQVLPTPQTVSNSATLASESSVNLGVTPLSNPLLVVQLPYSVALPGGALPGPATSVSATPSILDKEESHSNIPEPQGTQPSLWEQAFDKLPDNDKEILTTAAPFKGIDDILEATKKSRTICQEGRLKFEILGKEIIVRDVADKLVTWVDKFKSIGDIATGFDPVHTALPWAGVRFLLQVAVDSKEVMETTVIGVERVTRQLVRCAIYERLYLRSGLVLSVSEGLEDSLRELYLAILEFLAFALQYFGKGSTARGLYGLVNPDGTSRFTSIEQQESQLLKEVAVAEIEVRGHNHGILEAQNIKLRAVLEEMEKPIARINLNVELIREDLQDYIQDEKRIKILQWISNDEYESHHKTVEEGLLGNTGQWLLDNESFREWQSSSASGFFWLHGIPGAGKTSLTCAVINALGSTYPTHEPVVYFYYKRGVDQHKDPTAFMQAIVKQLSIVFSDLPEPVVKKFKEVEERGSTRSLTFTESRDLAILLIDTYPQTTIIIDALDECSPEGRASLLIGLDHIIHSSGSLVKIFISSRGDDDIKQRLEQEQNVEIGTANSGDIERFVRQEVTRRLHKKLCEACRNNIVLKLMKGANGMFQWIDLQIKQLSAMAYAEEIEGRAGALPSTLEGTYSQILDQILADEKKTIITKALMWVICSQKPLTQDLWAEATHWPEPIPTNGVPILFGLCRNLVVWDKQLNCVTFAHLSVREYLENREEFKPVEANSMAASTCLSLFSSSHWPAIEKPLKSPLKTTFVVYSIIHWGDHVERSYDQSMSKRMLKMLQQFLGTPTGPSKGFFNWQKGADKLLDHEKAHRYTGIWGSDPRDKDLLMLDHLKSTPPNPFFVMSYFRFGEEFEE